MAKSDEEKAAAKAAKQQREEAALYANEVERATRALEEDARLRQKVSSSLEDYIQGLKDSKKIKQTIARNEAIALKLQQKLKEALDSQDATAIDAAKKKLRILELQTEEIKKQGKKLDEALGSVNKKALLVSKTFEASFKGLEKLPGLIKKGYGEIKGLGLFELDKAMKMSALSMGILSKGTEGFRNTIRGAATQTNMMGIGIKELSAMQAQYSEELGRTVELSQDGLVAMGQMAAASGLGAEGSAQMAADMEKQGVSAERTGKYVEQTMNDAHKMGLNATKVMKNIAGNMKMLNRYNFKEGTAGLAKMAKTVTKLGVNMEFAAGMADKMFSVEGAVDMAAQLQVMGGEFAKMADPFHLMYMARNDINGLTEELGNAAAASAKFNAKTGEFDLGAMEMHKLKIIAEQTGVAYDDLVTAGKNAAKYAKIKSQINFSVGGGQEGKDLQEYLTNKSTLNKKGEATIMLNGNPKLLKQLTQTDLTALKAQMTEQESMKERAEAARTFDETLGDLMNQLKVYLIPFIDTLNKNLIPKLRELSDKFTAKGGWGEKLEKLATTVGELVSGIAGFVIDNPIMSAAVYLGTKLGGILWDKLSWISNGVLLAKGFNSAASVGGGGGDDITDMLGNGKKGGRFGKGKFGRLRSASKIGKFAKGWGGAGAGLLAAGVSGYDEYTENSAAGVSTGENVGRTGVRAAAAGGGAWGGAALGATIGTMIFPGVGTAIGGLIGGIAGGLAGDKIGDASGDAVWGKSNNGGLSIGAPVHDGFFEGGMDSMAAKVGGAFLNPLGAMGEMAMGLGSEYSKGRGVVQGGKIHPIDNKDDLVALKDNGIVANAAKSGGNNMKVDFGEIVINGKIMVDSPGNQKDGVDLLKNPGFIADLQRAVASQLEKNRNGGTNVA